MRKVEPARADRLGVPGIEAAMKPSIAARAPSTASRQHLFRQRLPLLVQRHRGGLAAGAAVPAAGVAHVAFLAVQVGVHGRAGLALVLLRALWARFQSPLASHHRVCSARLMPSGGASCATVARNCVRSIPALLSFLRPSVRGGSPCLKSRHEMGARPAVPGPAGAAGVGRRAAAARLSQPSGARGGAWRPGHPIRSLSRMYAAALGDHPQSRHRPHPAAAAASAAGPSRRPHRRRDRHPAAGVRHGRL